MPKALDELKRDVFFRLMEMAGRVFLLVRHSESVVIGKRGFLENEIQNGLVLVLNNKMKFSWDDDGLHANLVFGTVAEKCFIPASDIVSVYSPELRAHFVAAEDEDEATNAHDTDKHKGNIIEVDFKGKKNEK